MIAVLWSVHTRTLATSIITICPHLAGDPPAAANTRRRITGHRDNGGYLGSRYTGTGDWPTYSGAASIWLFITSVIFRLPSIYANFLVRMFVYVFQMSPHSSQVQVPGCGDGVYYWRVSSVNTWPGHSQATARPAATNRDLCERLFTQSSPQPAAATQGWHQEN